MDYFAKDIVGISAYDFYHAGDVALIQGHHAKCRLCSTQSFYNDMAVIHKEHPNTYVNTFLCLLGCIAKCVKL